MVSKLQPRIFLGLFACCLLFVVVVFDLRSSFDQSQLALAELIPAKNLRFRVEEKSRRGEHSLSTKDYLSLKLQASTPNKPSKTGPLYRIGDGIKFYPGAPGCADYPKSIVCEYQRTTQTPNSIPALLKVLEARNQSNQSEVPDPQVAVLHARLGDGLCTEVDWRCRRVSKGPVDCWNDKHDCFSILEPPYVRLAYPKEYYLKVARELNVNRLVIMANTNHFQDDRAAEARKGISTDERYLLQITEFFESQGFEVDFRLNGDADADFAYACAARTFIKCGGGFSRLISDVVKTRGGTVLPTTMDDSILFNS